MPSFSELGLPVPVLHALKKEGITHALPIQAAAIPDALEGRDVLGRGPTGSGKTFTFGLPMVTLLAGGASKARSPRGLILVPTRELAQQVADRLDPVCTAMGQRILSVVGGVNIKRNIDALSRPVDILVATPGRAIDLLQNRHLSLDAVRVCAVDEADHMADMGFLPQVTDILRRVPSSAQHLLFSATLDGDVNILVKRFLSDPVTHSTGQPTANVGTMTHLLGVAADRDSRNQLVIDLAKRPGKIIMFMRTKHSVDRQAKKLTRAGIRCVALHGDKGQNTRTRAVDDFTSGSASVLVATDIAARGIDIKGVDLVVHVDPPAEHKAYVHRAGRTARAGASGVVVTLCYPETEADVRKMMTKAGVSPTVVPGNQLLATLRSVA